MESVCSTRRGHETVALQASSLENTLTKTSEIRKRRLEMAMPALQRKRLERLDLHALWMGVEVTQSSSGSSSESAASESDRSTRRGDAGEQPVPDGAEDEKS